MASATANNAVVSGTRSWVAMINARSVITLARVATHKMACRLRCHASASVSTTKATSTIDADAGGRTRKRTVDSHSKGERINADVTRR